MIILFKIYFYLKIKNLFFFFRRFRPNRFVINYKTEKKRSFALALKIKRRALNYKLISRVPPFFCKKCGLASNYLHILMNHICLKKMAKTFTEQTDSNFLLNLINKKFS